MNNIFEKNILALINKNKNLSEKLISYIPTEVPQLLQENGQYNLLYKNQLMHNKVSPLGEAREIFAGSENTPATIHLIYGLGLGYLFQVASLNSNGIVILYEPDLNILKTSFMLVDFSNDILKQNVFVTDNLEEVSECIYKNSNTENSPLLLSTIAYRNLNQSGFNDLVETLQRLVGSFNMDRKFTQEKFYPLLNQTLSNILHMVNEVPLWELKDLYKGKTAVVVSAGPTLDRNVEIIRKYRENIVLVVVGTALKTLTKNDLVPDFLCIIESFDSSKQLEDVDTTKINFVTEPFSHPNLRNFEFKNVFAHVSSNMPTNAYWSEVANIKSDEYFSKGTVSYTALNTARILGCSKIVLVGQDLAYIEGQCYSKDSAYKDLVCKYNEELKKWEISANNFEDFANSLSNNPDKNERINVAIRRLERLNNSLYYVKGIRGDMVPTESVYAAFIKPLTEFTQTYTDIEYINTSLVGAQIDGFSNIDLETALKDSVKIDNRDINVDFHYDISLIKENLYKSKNNLSSANYILEEMLRLCKNIKNDVKRYRTVNADVLKSLKKLMTGYEAMSVDFAHKSTLFDLITAPEKIDVEYEIKMVKEFNVENVLKVAETVEKYASIAENKIKEISAKIDSIIGVL